MKQSLLALALALTMLPVAAAAQNAPPQGGPPSWTPEQRQAMMQTFKTFRDQTEKLEEQTRTEVLAGLSAVHRQAVANIVGGLAVSAKPDVDVAVRQIDAILSPAEKSAILSAHNALRSQMETLHQQMRAQMERTMPAGAPPAKEHFQMRSSKHAQSNDPGKILLHILASGVHGDHMVMMMRGGFGGPPPH
ncbi:MAG TPA: hypothetical protein VMH02_10670 [Verrucomicrobiae bacterium]|nr:hypothetical protein [Verrucomicrobiae bacterium]